MITVLVVDDSPSVRDFMTHVLSSDPGLRVIGTAGNGEEALELARSRKPDVITMDIHMPKMDGFEATRRIMETCPVPIVIVSGSTSVHEIATTFRALEMGALAVVPRPDGIGHAQHEVTARGLVETVKLMSEVKVVKRWASSRAAVLQPRVSARESSAKHLATRVELVAVGASTGGPQALHVLLSRLPKDFPAPVVIVQHIAAGFLGGLVEWLSGSCALPIHIAREGESIQAGNVYIAPDGYQMAIRGAGLIRLVLDAPVNLHRPSVSYLFRSVAETYGRKAAGVLLTGMGKDGAEELRLMKQGGAVTIAQDAKTSVVHGMPGEAIRLEAAAYVLEPAAIATLLSRLAQPG
ncbi:MAG: chemotaxis-specific protein-glutamate methyltransferase CheB [Acidiferrobacteraceae bacterium]